MRRYHVYVTTADGKPVEPRNMWGGDMKSVGQVPVIHFFVRKVGKELVHLLENNDIEVEEFFSMLADLENRISAEALDNLKVPSDRVEFSTVDHTYIVKLVPPDAEG